MRDRDLRCSRRKFLASAAGLALAGNVAPGGTTLSPPGVFARPPKPDVEGRDPVAVLGTVYRPLSHLYHLAGRFLHGYPRHGRLHIPAQYIHSVWVDQAPENDLSRELAREFGFRRTRTVADALLDGDRLAIRGVLIVAEHGNYPRNAKGQVLYPRYEIFEQVVETFRRTGQTAPVFVANHLSYRWDRAAQMAAWAKELKFPLMAGSFLPTTWRRPELELPPGEPIAEALMAAYGPIEVYGFHALEALQCMIERRTGGETGVRAATCLTGKEVWRAGDDGRWSWDLLEAALARSETVNPGDVRRNVGLAVGTMPAAPATAFLVEYRDGLRGTVLLLNGHVQDFTFAARLPGEAKPAACRFLVPPPPGARHFDGQALAVEQFLTTGRPPQPLERTLLTTGVLDALLESHVRRGERVETPELAVAYQAPVVGGFLQGDIV